MIARRQLEHLGIDRFAIRRRVSRGTLHSLHEGWVYSVGSCPLSTAGRYLAAVMAVGSDARLSHRAGGDLWGLRPCSARLEVTVPALNRQIPGIQVHRSRVLTPQDIAVKDGIPVTSVARTLLDLSAILSPSDLEAALDRAERLRIFDLYAVLEVLDRARGRKGAKALRHAIAAYRPSSQKSELERRFRALLGTAPDIPRPFFNAVVNGESRTHEVDALWEPHRLVVQVDGYEFHRTRRDREHDAASDGDLELVGCRVLRFTWDDVTVNPDRTLRRVRLALGVP